MNYTYVGRDLDSYDWVAATDFNKARGIYMPAADLVERIIAQKKPGSIIPLQVGMVGGPQGRLPFPEAGPHHQRAQPSGVSDRAGLHADGACPVEAPEGGTAVNANDPVHAYKEIQIKTANQIRLIVMLYDGAIRHLNLALDAFADGHRRYDVINNHIIAAQDILSELTASLDFEKGGVLAKNLFSLYTFMNRQLLEANMKKDPSAAADGEEAPQRPSRGLG